MKRKLRRMRSAVRWVAAAMICLSVVAPLRLDNAYLRSGDFDTVRVERHECVWEIASRYTTNRKDVRALVEAIIEVNDLSPDGALRVGQSLRVPVIREALPPKVAAR